MPRRRTQRAGTPTSAAARVAVSLLATALLAAAFARGAREEARPRRSVRLPEAARALLALHGDPQPAAPGSWRAGPGRDERGQSHDDWRRARPRTARGPRRVLYVVAIGPMPARYAPTVDATERFLALWFGLDVRRLPDVPLDAGWPSSARRTHPGTGGVQLLTSHLLTEVLPGRLPRDGAALLALTVRDLWPGDGWSFVFGEASRDDRVAVASLARLGADGARPLLERLLKIAVHETGHVFSMEHCTAYPCAMGGSNGLRETDRQPLRLCPECLAKVWDATGVDPRARFAGLAAFFREAGLAPAAEHCLRSAARL